jgi:hypothetical protein
VWIQIKTAKYKRTLLITGEFRQKWRKKGKKIRVDKNRRSGKWSGVVVVIVVAAGVW